MRRGLEGGVVSMTGRGGVKLDPGREGAMSLSSLEKSGRVDQGGKGWSATSCAALSTALQLSLHCLLVGAAAGVLGLHHVWELWGAGEGIDAEGLKGIIWKRRRRKTHEICRAGYCKLPSPQSNKAKEVFL